jgi:hypothetical protein
MRHFPRCGTVAGRFPCHANALGLISRATQLFLGIQLWSSDDAAVLCQLVWACTRRVATHVVVNRLQKTVMETLDICSNLNV